MGGRGAWSSINSIQKIKKVNSTIKVNIDDDKIYKFALKENAKHSKDFFNTGYTKNDGEKLKKDLEKVYKTGKKENIKENLDTGDIKFEIISTLGKNKMRFLTAWQIDTGENNARFITGYRI